MNETASSFRSRLRSRWPEWLTICLFAAAVSYTIPFHEPWVDEAQAWQLTRSLSLGQLFATYLRYEGSPGLWHFLLWIMIRLHVSYTGMHWIGGAIAVGSTAVLVLNAPFPRYLKLTLPFTFYLVYQYAIVARNYVLAPPLLFLIATYWKKRPVAVAVALGLLANVSLHCACISGGIAIVFLVERLRAGDGRDSRLRRQLWTCAGIAAAFYAFALATAWPPSDIKAHAALQHLQPTFFHVVGLLVLPTCQPVLLAIPFWAFFVLLLGSRRCLIYLVPLALMLGFCIFALASYWHYGLFVPLIFFISWVTWPPPGTRLSKLEIAGRIALCYMVATQIVWSAHAIAYDRVNLFSPDLAASKILRPYVAAGDTIVITSMDEPDEYASTSIGILPYFDRNIYSNLPQPFFQWDDNNPVQSLYREALPSHPRIVLMEAQRSQLGPNLNLNYPRIIELTKLGYRLTNVFCGAMPFRTGEQDTYCHLVFRTVGGSR